MPDYLDVIGTVDEHGNLDERTRKMVRANIRARKGSPVRVRISAPARSNAQNDLYWAQLGEISDAYAEAGLDEYTAELLHAWYKIRFLPRVQATVLRETGEALDCVRLRRFPDGSEERVYTTTKLSVPAFSLYYEMVQAAAREDIGCKIADAPGKPRSGKLYEWGEAA